ncbi:MAG: alpha/beta hydrolase [Chloroflexi bacterium]|nr:alpha/beta hydrolase [Chloroflexota bacterium]
MALLPGIAERARPRPAARWRGALAWQGACARLVARRLTTYTRQSGWLAGEARLLATSRAERWGLPRRGPQIGRPVRDGRLTSRWYVVGGLRLHARVSIEPVPPASPTVVLVHGLIVSSRYMLPTATRLAPRCRVHIPDLPGYGRSAKPERVLRVPELADALAGYLASAGLDHVALVANSFGCQIAADCAMRHPERIARVVLIGPTVDPAARALAQQVARWLRNVPGEPPWLGLVIARDLVDMGVRRALCTLRFMLEDRIEAKLPHVRVPTLVVRGARDTVVPQRWAEEATRLLPAGRLAVIPGAAHTVNYNAPLELVRVVYPFVAQAERA